MLLPQPDLVERTQPADLVQVFRLHQVHRMPSANAKGIRAITRIKGLLGSPVIALASYGQLFVRLRLQWEEGMFQLVQANGEVGYGYSVIRLIFHKIGQCIAVCARHSSAVVEGRGCIVQESILDNTPFSG